MDLLNQSPVPMAPLLLTPKEARSILRIGERKLFELTKEGTIPCVRIGRLVRYDPADLRTWIEANKNSNNAATGGEVVE
jgi:excisionase family DNA binding protein